MKTEDFAILAAAAVAVVAMLKFSGILGGGRTFSTPSLTFSRNDDGSTHLTPADGVTVGSLMNTGIGYGVYTTPVTDAELFHTGATAGLF